MKLGRGLVIALLCSACSARISTGGGRHADLDAGAPDTSPDPDAAVDPGLDAMPVATCATRTVFLNFDGANLTRGPSDAPTNQAEWMTINQGAAPPYHATNTGRVAEIQQILDGVRSELARFPINVVTTRPTTGEYVMIVLGGQASQIGSRYTSAVNQLDCNDSRHNDVAWVADSVAPPQAVVNIVIGAIGFGIGLTASSDPRDCMCSWANGCTPDTANPCTLGAPIARDQSANQLCPGATQDEVSALRTAFCGTH